MGPALMGFDPEAASQTLPFTRANNHLTMARKLGLGTDRLDEIPVIGENLEAMRFPFQPVEQGSSRVPYKPFYPQSLTPLG
jgi:hypothetical protein